MLRVYVVFLLCAGIGLTVESNDEEYQTSQSQASASATSSYTSSSASSSASASSWSSNNSRKGRICRKNATFKERRTSCPPTCKNPNPQQCNKKCLEPGCECNPGYLLHKGMCIQLKDCPAAKSCGANETYVACRAGCPTDYCPKDDGRYMVACDPPYPCPPGCVCKGNYRKLSEDNPTCILAKDCPPVQCTRQNEEWNPCPSICLAQYCSDLYGKHEINECQKDYPHYCEPKCVCKKNFYRNSNDDCVAAEECSQQVPKCGFNEEAVICRTICPPQSCENAYTEYDCSGAPKCEPGCDCIQGHLRNQSGICIPSDSCSGPSPQCQDHASYTGCLSDCPPTCEKQFPEACIALCRGSGCQCDKGYVAHGEKCIRPQDCPNTICESKNATYTNCLSACPPTCEEPSPQACILMCKGAGCTCNSGYVLQNGNCILPQDCNVQSCEDENASYTKCLSACPPTCDNPFPEVCTKDCKGAGCSCKPGYVLHQGRCILFSNCPGAIQCSINQTYVPCVIGCPTRYCPRNDLRVYPQCLPRHPCPPGCVCKGNYLISNDDNKNCILSSECPPVECTRKNEEWNSCPSNCLAESCEDINQGNQVSQCVSDNNCGKPRCVCKENFNRNKNDECVPREECCKMIRVF